MKAALLFLFSLAIFFGQKLLAQSNFYFADSTAQWNLLETEQAQNALYSTVIFQASGNVFMGSTYYYQEITSEGNSYFVRSDTTGKVFYRAVNDSMDRLIYDFGRTQGDNYSFYNPWISSDTIYVTVQSTDTVHWDKPRKEIVICLHFGAFSNTCDNDPLVCVEGVGALNSHFLFPGIDQAIAGGVSYNLLCYFDDSNQVYHNTNYQSCSLNSGSSGIDEMSWQNEVHILPNPVTDNFVTIQFDESPPPVTSIRLFDLTGRIILQQPLTGKLNRIGLNDIAKGMYLYTIISPEQRTYSGKLVID